MKDYILGNYSLLGAAEVIGFGDDGFYIKEIDRDTANRIIIKNHYSKKIYSGSYIHLGVFMDGELVGILQYGYAMNPQSMDGVVAGTKIDEYLELNRMWLHDKAPRNSESKAISYSIKYIKRKYKKIKWIQSFADERCGRFGVVYQAANFQYYGEHKSDFWELDGVVYHNIIMTVKEGASQYNATTKRLQENRDRATKYSLRQFRYLYFINEREKKNCRLKQKPYPKHGAIV
ncbi:MAG: hypothetical protein WC374_05925 [Phycisphaerae bacterium]|jgi:hypothetical protein